ncbi:MAG TPA: hypothetical protein VFX92_03350 [Candidatus Krumholzibacteria bacterium]|nr:hypothetical protein [Candidatus Krumholzibacteria bacterium]
MNRLVRVVCVPLLLLVASCQGSGDLPLDQVDAEAVVAEPTYDQVHAIVQRACDSCHAGRAEPALESCLDIVEQRNSILDTAEANTMPPGALPRLTSEEKLAIRRWIDAGAPAPCN